MEGACEIFGPEDFGYTDELFLLHCFENVAVKADLRLHAVFQELLQKAPVKPVEREVDEAPPGYIFISDHRPNVFPEGESVNGRVVSLEIPTG